MCSVELMRTGFCDFECSTNRTQLLLARLKESHIRFGVT